MRRRRRPKKDIEFSFDSFLDVVANVVGIILRLILVAWAGAKAYKGPPPPPPPPLPALESLADLPTKKDPLEDDLSHQQQLLLQAQAQLLEHMKKAKDKEIEQDQLANQVKTLADQRRKTEEEKNTVLATRLKPDDDPLPVSALSLEDFQARSKTLLDQINELRKQPSVKKALRYRTPVSHPLQSEEIHIECLHGRVTVVDVGGLEEEIGKTARDKVDLLKTTWEVPGMTGPVGEFRLRYVLVREAGELENRDLPPNPNSPFRAGIAGWEAVPIRAERGETADQALKPKSEFRRLMDHIEPNQTAVTFWVYPDSYAEYRRLRDYLHEKEIVVAARPMMPDMPIAASRSGSASRGQ